MDPISVEYGVEKQFPELIRRLALTSDIVPPSEDISPSAIYESPSLPVGTVSEDFSPKEVIRPIAISLPEDAEYITCVAYRAEERPPPGTIEKMAPAKNFLDIFFDWLNKILSGK